MNSVFVPVGTMEISSRIKMVKSNEAGLLLTSGRINKDPLLKQHKECTDDNKKRLKKVKNLEELINFKVSSVANLTAKRESDFMDGQLETSQAN